MSMVGSLLISDIDLVGSVPDKQTYFFGGLFLGEYGRKPVDFSYRLGQYLMSKLTSLVDFFLVSMVGSLLISDIELVSSVPDRQTYSLVDFFLVSMVGSLLISVIDLVSSVRDKQTYFFG